MEKVIEKCTECGNNGEVTENMQIDDKFLCADCTEAKAYFETLIIEIRARVQKLESLRDAGFDYAIIQLQKIHEVLTLNID